MNTTVEVTNKHILRGSMGSCGQCPVAMAIREVVLCGLAVEVYPSTIILVMPGGFAVLDTPKEAASFIREYDDENRNYSPSPFAFQLDIPARFLKAAPARPGEKGEG